MFILTKLSDSVRVQPADFRKARVDAIADELNKKYANKVVHQVGLCICLFDVIEMGDPAVVPGDGCIHSKVTFRLVVFRPFIGEVLVGKIRTCSPQGVHVSLGFFDDIIIPPADLQDNTVFDSKEQVWVWQYNGHQLYMDVDEEIRFRVQEEIFVDTMPTTSPDSGAALAAKPSAEQRHAPYTIHGFINQDGLGLLSWWPTEDS